LVRKLAYDAGQESRIKYRREAPDEENKLLMLPKSTNRPVIQKYFSQKETLKLLPARSRYLLFKHQSKW
jgi:hypothetical protein